VTVLACAKPYWSLFSARFRLLLQYRVAALAGLTTQLFWGLIRMMVFLAFYENATGIPMSREQTITYIWLGQAFLMLIPIRLDGELARMVRTGNVAYEMLRPVDLYNYWFSRAVAARVAPTSLRAGPILIAAGLAGWIGRPAWTSVAAFAMALAGAVAVGSAITVLMNIVMLWTVSGRGLSLMLMAVTYALCGIVIPLPLYPDYLQGLLSFLPFRQIMDVPFRLFAGHIPASDLPSVLAQQAAWTIALVLCGRLLLGRATRRLVVQGG
jgi:ABC-2 type transport system permease protein